MLRYSTISCCALIACVTLLGVPSRADATCVERASWPTAGFPRRTSDAKVLSSEAVAAYEQFLFSLDGEDGDRKGTRTDSAMIIHQGAVFYERNARGWKASMPHLAWSVTKSVYNTLTGVAVQQGVVRLDDSICKHHPDVPAASCKVTVQNLLEFSSGFDWAETYEGKSNQESSVLAMLYGEGQPNMPRFVASHAFRDEPGTSYMYSTGDSTLLGSVVERAMAKRFGEDYAWDLLFNPLGMQSPVIERDTAKNPGAGSYFYATPEDFGKLGYLWLSGGCWAGAQLLPDTWMEDSTQPSKPFLNKRYDTDPDDQQGRQFWLNRFVAGVNDPRPWPDVPEDAYAARGHWGQSIVVIPSKDIVLVRQADDREKTFNFNRYVQLAMAVVGVK
jgi:CubicO group peptidase (beta-lactamase class C family)